MAKSETRTDLIYVKLMPTVRSAVKKAAAADRRSMSAFVEKLLIDHLKATGYLDQDLRERPSLRLRRKRVDPS